MTTPTDDTPTPLSFVIVESILNLIRTTRSKRGSVCVRDSVRYGCLLLLLVPFPSVRVLLSPFFLLYYLYVLLLEFVLLSTTLIYCV